MVVVLVVVIYALDPSCLLCASVCVWKLSCNGQKEIEEGGGGGGEPHKERLIVRWDRSVWYVVFIYSSNSGCTTRMVWFVRMTVPVGRPTAPGLPAVITGRCAKAKAFCRSFNLHTRSSNERT